MRSLLLAAALAFTACAGTSSRATAPETAPETAPAPAPAPEPAPSFVVENGRLVVPGAVTFATGDSEILADSEATLRHVVAFLAAKPAITLLRIEVHADASSAPAAAQASTEQRALAVRDRLVALGADRSRLLPVGFGSSKPIADEGTPAGRAQNRRVEFHPAAMRGKPIGGLPEDGGGRVAKESGG